MVVISPASSESAVPADMEEIAEEDYNEDTDESVDDGESHTPAYIYNMKKFSNSDPNFCCYTMSVYPSTKV